MKILFSAFSFSLFTLLFTTPASAWSLNSIGGTDYYNYGSGTGTGRNIGGSYYYNDSFGWSGRNYGIGSSTYYDYNNYNSGSSLNGRSYSIGGNRYYNLYDNSGNSYSGRNYSIGNRDYYQFGNKSYSCSWIGNRYYCN